MIRLVYDSRRLRATRYGFAVALIACLLTAGCGDRARYGAVGNLGRLAGYAWGGRVVSISASWVVPRIGVSSPRGRAGTWIGAQAAPGDTSPFIQVGTNEELRSPSALAQYYTFWTDTVRGFIPVFLFSVRAGDPMRADLVLRRGHWLVSISDLRSHVRRHFRTAQDAHRHFSTAEWFQEDILGGEPSWPYPSLGPVRFYSVHVNGRSPQNGSSFSEWMSVGRSYLGPTAFSTDGFIINRVVLAGARLRYLQTATAEDIAVYRFDKRFGVLGVRSPARRFLRADRPLVSLLVRFESRLESGNWPPGAAKLINRLINLTRRQVVLLKRGPENIRGELVEFRRSLESDGEQTAVLSTAIRRALNLPEITPRR